MNRLVLAALCAALAACLAPASPPARRAPCVHGPRDAFPLRVGSQGCRVRGLQYLLTGQRPTSNAYRLTVHPRRKPPTGQYGKATARQVRAAKWLLGYPTGRVTCGTKAQRGQRFTITGTAGRQFFQILQGQRARPLCWVGRASHRLQVLRRQTAARAPPCARRLVAVAKRELALGVREIPSHSNSGPRVRVYQASTAYGGTGWPWCMAFDQYVTRTALGHWLDSGTAGVYVGFFWGQRHGYIRARPVVGAFVLYLTGGGHTGVVTGVSRTAFSTIEGNSRDAVTAHSYPLGYRRSVFLVLPCVQR